MRGEPPPQVWVHFPRIPSRGCEGVLVVQVQGERPIYHALLVDGEHAQVELLARWVEKWPSNDGSTINWVVSHYHRDHIGERNLLTYDALWGRIGKIFCPSSLWNDWPSQTEAALRELGSKITTAYQKNSASAPQIQPIKVGSLETIWYHGGVHVVVTGGTPGKELSESATRQMNARSLIVLGTATQGKLGKAKPFSFIFPGDAEEATWDSFLAQLDVQTDFKRGLPLALLKLSHHGAYDANPKKVLSQLFGPLPAPRGGQLAVRVLNAPKAPKGKDKVESALAALKVPMWDTREKGELWVRLTYGEPLFITQDPTEVNLRLPDTLKQSCASRMTGHASPPPAAW